jgi:signal transduction histidine kinase
LEECHFLRLDMKELMESQLIKNLLRKDIAEKSAVASLGYIALATLFMLYRFNSDHDFIIKIASMMVVLSSLWRLLIVKKIKEKAMVSLVQWNRLKLSVWILMVSWSTIFTTISIEFRFSGEIFIVSTTLMCGITAASLLTLSTDRSLFIPFQLLLLGPQIFIMAVNYLTKGPLPTNYLLPTYIVYLAYQLYQHRIHRAAIISNLRNELQLKDSNDELKLSQIIQNDQTAKLIHTSRLAALGEMSAGIAHEVNNPLAIISGSMEQLERIAVGDPREQRKLFDTILKSQNSVRRISKIITGLRHFAQQSDHKPKSIVMIEMIITDTLSFCSEMLKAHHIELTTRPVPEAWIECHPVQISQVLINVIKNAEDAILSETDPADRWISINFELTTSLACIKVANGGKSIPIDIQDKLFDPFFTTKSIGSGTGLGLSISRGIMREHGGDLILLKERNYTTFVLVLPLHDRPQPTLAELH